MKINVWQVAAVFCCVLWPLHVSAEITNTKEVAKKVDIILLQDESGSMVPNDPQHIRSHVATFLMEDMEMAGEGNRMALLLFASRAEEKVDLSREFKRIREASLAGFPSDKGLFDRTSWDRVPARAYTDIYGALEAALQMLKKESAGEKGAADQLGAEKHVILLTDGRIDPWPGNEQRYGSVASEYLTCVRQSGHTKCDSRFKDRVEAMDKEALFDPSGPLAAFKKNGWRVHCVGFSQGVDLDLLNKIAAATYGNAGIAADYTQLLNILEQIIPPAPNVVTLLVKDFCKTRRVEESIQIDSDIKAVQFKVDLNAMLAQKTSIKPENLKIVLIAPNGTEIRSQDGKFTFNTTKEGLVVTATHFQERPEPGRWRIIVEGVGADICGKLGVTGRVPFVPKMDITPEISDYYGGQGIGVSVFLKNKESNENVPIRNVKGRFKFSPEGGGKVHEEEIKFGVRGNAGESENFRIPEGIKGTAAIEATVTDGKYGSRMQQLRTIKVEPSPGEAEISADPPRISLGAVGDDIHEIASAPVTLSTPSHVPVEVIVKRPKLSSGAHDINILWVTVTPASGVISAGKPLKFTVQVAFPKDASLSLPKGLYTGEIEVSAKNMKGECAIPVDLEVEVPQLFVEPSRLDMDFWFRMGAPMAQSIEVGHTSNQDRTVRMELPRFFKDSRGKYEKNIAVGVPNMDVLEWPVNRGDTVKIPVEVSLTNLSLNKAQRMPRGTYQGRVVITGEGLNPKEVEIRVAIPETPAVVKYGRPLALVMTGILGFLALMGLALFIHRSSTRVFRGKKYRIVFDRDGDMKAKTVKRFECVFRKGKDETGQEDVFSMPAEGNRKIHVEDPSSGDMVQFPDHGIPNIEHWNGGPLEAIHTGHYKYKNPEPKGKRVALRAAESPYGTATGYFFKKVVVWLIFGIAAAGAAYWFHQIV